MARDMKAISLFSGVGGFDLGFERAGIETVLQAERDPHCLKVLERHWPAVERVDDVAKVGRWALEKYGAIDLVHGGFPCQDVSFANGTLKGPKGLEGERSGLWSEFVRVLRELRPGYAVVENVGALSSRGLGAVITDLAEVGYDAEWTPVYASDFGAAHRRERIYIVATAHLRDPDDFGVCECCDALWCDIHDAHFSECACRGIRGEVECGGCGEWWNLLDESPCPRCGWVPTDACRERAQVQAPGAQPTESFFGSYRPAEGTGRRIERWPVESRIYRGTDGVPGGMDGRWARTHALGNAVVVPVIEWIGHRLVSL
jgi:DNA (cytosine-5)-methyltransferase 1